MVAAERSSNPEPPLRLKLGFWLLLGMLSTAFAEVVSGSDPFPFFLPWGFLVVTPLYSLHTLVLATIIVRFRMLTWQGLCFAGAVFGLYEAYITKVLFDPPWGQEVALSFAGVAWAHAVLLVLWWHPLMAFFVPLLIAETLLTKSRLVLDALPASLRTALTTGRRPLLWTVGFAVCCGLMTSGTPTTIGIAVVSIVSNGVLLLFLVWFWRTRLDGTRLTMDALLPGRKGLAVCAVLLGALYLVAGPFLRAESLPAMDGHVAIAVAYVLFAAALFRCRAFYRVAPSHRTGKTAGTMPWFPLGAFVITYAVTTVCSKQVLGSYAIAFPLANWLVGGLIGLLVYGRALYSLWSGGHALPVRADVEADPRDRSVEVG